MPSTPPEPRPGAPLKQRVEPADTEGMSSPAYPLAADLGAPRNGAHGVVGAFLAALRRDAASEWRVQPRLAQSLFLLPILLSPFVALSWLHKPLFRFLTGEDGLFEWLGFGAYVVAAVAAGLAARELARRGQRLHTVLFVLFTLGCVLVAGEEISWGQRIFGFGTPEGLSEINRQSETTVHNIGLVQNTFNGIVLLGGLYGSLVAGFLRLRGGLGESARRFVPPLFLTSAFLLAFAFRLGRFTIVPEYDGIIEYGEWVELCFASALALFAGLTWRKLRV